MSFLTPDIPHLAPGTRLVVPMEVAPGEAVDETDRGRKLVAEVLMKQGATESQLVLAADASFDVPGADGPPDRVVVQGEGCPPPHLRLS